MDGPLRRLAKRLQPADVTLRGLAHVAEADQRGRNGKEQRALSVEEVPELKEWQAWYFNDSKRLRVLDCAPEPILRGQHVIEKWADLKPGEWVGKILKEVLELQFSGKVISLNQALVEAERIFEKMAIQGLVLI